MAIWQVWLLITVVKAVVIAALFPLWGWAVLFVGLPLVAVSIVLVVVYLIKERRERAPEAPVQQISARTEPIQQVRPNEHQARHRAS